ncbi:hypothetical protein L873DRAFT_1816893 [Choiromyces venosus 120613-1]|uniref:Uncharacterized protein n=1 Tax=Choiromyces venosus 120613-1 TaxID=1336337 RepID=A0A3N4J6M0_9PEZI|nr:hypothetical protein L873DRAFT_1816893 [Choiromyces venosus 120613-1]
MKDSTVVSQLYPSVYHSKLSFRLLPSVYHSKLSFHLSFRLLPSQRLLSRNFFFIQQVGPWEFALNALARQKTHTLFFLRVILAWISFTFVKIKNL